VAHIKTDSVVPNAHSDIIGRFDLVREKYGTARGDLRQDSVWSAMRAGYKRRTR